jgi:hypothetical protein
MLQSQKTTVVNSLYQYNLFSQFNTKIKQIAKAESIIEPYDRYKQAESVLTGSHP